MRQDEGAIIEGKSKEIGCRDKNCKRSECGTYFLEVYVIHVPLILFRGFANY